MSTYRTEGVILRRSNFGEANLLLHIFTKDFGKVEAVGKSARKPQGKLKGHLEPFLYSDFVLVHGKKMDTVANSFVMDAFLNLRGEMELILFSSVILEVADRITLENYHDEKMFHLILESMNSLESASPQEKNFLWLVILFFEINALSLSGFAPQSESCVFCSEKPNPGKNYFSFSLGGVLDYECAQRCPDAFAVSDDTVRLLRFLSVTVKRGMKYEDVVRFKLSELRRLSADRSVILRSALVMKNFVEFNIDQKINSLEVLCNFAREEI
ncbi:MAG: DNA repair protein RecO [Candidatus Pacebacteria bacterium]|nr:DNA repair protein RecO [Candidatus Paceibacterota bacterium]